MDMNNVYGLSRVSQDYLDNVLGGNFPENAPDGFKQRHSTYQERVVNLQEANIVRSVLIRHGIYPLIENSWIRKLAKYLTGKRCLEIMAGSGWLSHGLRNFGINCTATDKSARYDGAFNVTRMAAIEAVEKIPADIIVVSWPPVHDNHICEIMDIWGCVKEIVYIGEVGGCTACDEFHANFKPHLKIEKDNWKDVDDHIFIGRWQRNR